MLVFKYIITILCGNIGIYNLMLGTIFLDLGSEYPIIGSNK